MVSTSSDSLLEDMKPCDTSKETLFVLLRKTSLVPPFDTRFINYGFNRQEWTEHLRSKGYSFKVFRDGYLVEVPHVT